MVDVEDMALLGTAIYCVQKFEFTLYAIASHCAHTTEAQSARQFRDLDPEAFLRGDISQLRATLGNIVRVFGDRFLISGDDLDHFVQRRNDIAHNFWRFTSTKFQPSPIDDPKEYLREFVDDANRWQRIARGLLSLMQRQAAKNEGRMDELEWSHSDLANIKEFHQHVRSRASNVESAT